MARSVTAEMAAAGEAAKVKTQRKARGTTPKAEAEVAETPTPKRQSLPEGQQRSRGRTILSARTVKGGDAVIACNFPKNGCANPSRWPVGTQPELAEHPEVKARTVTCTTHLRTILNARNMIERQAEFETLMVGGTVKATPKRRRTRKASTKATATA